MIMDNTPIKTENDYNLVLQEIEGLMNAASGTPEGNRLDTLSTLVAAWEEKHHIHTSPDSSSSGL